jgi:hypothetical protein
MLCVGDAKIQISYLLRNVLNHDVYIGLMGCLFGISRLAPVANSINSNAISHHCTLAKSNLFLGPNRTPWESFATPICHITTPEPVIIDVRPNAP